MAFKTKTITELVIAVLEAATEVHCGCGLSFEDAIEMLVQPLFELETVAFIDGKWNIKCILDSDFKALVKQVDDLVAA